MSIFTPSAYEKFADPGGDYDTVTRMAKPPTLAIPLSSLGLTQPLGMPQVASSSKPEAEHNNCWMATYLSAWCNNPYIVMFVLDVMTPSLELHTSSRQRETMLASSAVNKVHTTRYNDFRKSGDRELCLHLLRILYLLVRGGSNEQIKKHAHALYSLKIQHTKTDDTMNDPRTEGENDMRIMVEAMFFWWAENQWMYTFFRRYCIVSQMRVEYHCNFCQLQNNVDYPLRQVNEMLTQMDTIDPLTISKDFMDQRSSHSPIFLDHVLNEYFFNSSFASQAIDPTKHLPRKNGLIHTKRSCEGRDKEFIAGSSVYTLPMRFAVRVNRTSDAVASTTPKNSPVIHYNPNSLLLGPTHDTKEWGHYRLVARYEHKGLHWTSVVLSPYETSQLEIPSEAASKVHHPGYKHYNFSSVTDVDAKQSNTLMKYNTKTGLCEDNACAYLIFARYDGTTR